MGTSLDNVHVYIPDLSVENAIAQVINAVRQQMRNTSFLEVTDSAQSQMTLTLIGDASNPWVSLYDSRRIPNSSEVASAISSHIGYPTLHVDVFDSDVTRLDLYANNKKQDTYSNWINYDSHPPRIGGDATKWQIVLPKDQSVDQLKQAWKMDKADYPFEAEGALGRIVDVLNLGADRAWHRPSDDIKFPASHVVSLYFRYSQALPYDNLAEGLPSFSPHLRTPKQDLYLNERFGLMFSVLNRGGASQGIEILVRGTALAHKLIEPVGIITEVPFDHNSGTITAYPEIDTEKASQFTCRFQLDAYSIKAGLADFDALYKLPTHLRDFEREFALPQMMSFVGKAINGGDGEIEIIVIPLSNRAHGTTIFKTQISVTKFKAYKL